MWLGAGKILVCDMINLNRWNTIILAGVKH